MAKSQNDKSTKSAKSEMYDLFTYFRSSCSYRVRIALNYKDLPYKSIPINLKEGLQHSDSYKRINAQKFVPMLKSDDLPNGLGQSLARGELVDVYLAHK